MLHKNKVKGLLVLIEFIVLICVFNAQTFASLYINEFSSGTTSDWIEIYNSDSTEIDLADYILRDSTSTNKLELSGVISGNGFLPFDWSNKLNNSGDTIRLLKKTDESSVDQIIYGEGGALGVPLDTQTAGRTPDGSQNWVVLSTSSKGGSNNAASAVPTATPIPTVTPTPTKTPTPTRSVSSGQAKTPTPVPTSKPINTSIPTKTPTPTIKQSVTSAKPSVVKNKPTPFSSPTPLNTSVLAVSDEEPSPSPEHKNSKGPRLFAWGKLFILMGVVIICSAYGILIYKKYKQEREEEI